jgi:urea transport system permease protein
MLDGDFYFLKANKQLVRYQVAANNLYQLTDVLTAEPLQEVKNVSQRSGTNNSLRSTLRSIIAKIDFN